MKRKLLFTLVSVPVFGLAWSCWAMAQSPTRNVAPLMSLSPTATPTGTLANVSVSGSYEVTALEGAVTQEATYRDAAGHTHAVVNDSDQNEVPRLVKELTDSKEERAKAEILGKLNDVIGKQFDKRQEARLQELVKLEEQLIRLKEVHTKRSKQRDQIVGERVQQLVRESEGLGWGTKESNLEWAHSYQQPSFYPLQTSAVAPGFAPADVLRLQPSVQRER